MDIEHLILPPTAVRSSTGKPYKPGDHTTINGIVYRVSRVDSTGVYGVIVPPLHPQKG